jgi:hypothetical protein
MISWRSRPVLLAACAACLAGFAGVIAFLFMNALLYTAGSPTLRAPAAPRPAWSKSLDEALERLLPARIAFNAPATMQFKETSTIELLLSLTEPMEVLKARVKEIGEKEGFEIRVSSQMEANLQSVKESAFYIVSATPEVQFISPKESTRWLWKVTPLDWGSQELELTLSALLSVDGRDGKRAVRTFEHKIAVDVTPWQRAHTFLEKNWQWAWTALLIPAGAWGWRRIRMRKPKSRKRNRGKG